MQRGFSRRGALSGSRAPAAEDRRSRQSGQALAEGMIAMAALAVVGLAIADTGRWHMLAQEVGLAARQAAFAWTRGDLEAGGAPLAAAAPLASPASAYSSAFPAFPAFPASPASQASPAFPAPRSPAGSSSLAPGRAPALRLAPIAALADAGQPGAAHGGAAELRRQWGLHDEAIQAAFASVAGLRQPFGGGRPTLRRHVAVLAGAGHAGSDAAVQQRVAQSALAWADASRASMLAGSRVADRTAPADRAWGRPAPVFDWLGPWAGAVPRERTPVGAAQGRGR